VSPHVPIISEENKTLPHSIRKVSAAALDTRHVLFVVRSEMCHSSTSWACCTAAVPPAGKCIALIAFSIASIIITAAADFGPCPVELAITHILCVHPGGCRATSTAGWLTR
jgi:hypothetical protein